METFLLRKVSGGGSADLGRASNLMMHVRDWRTPLQPPYARLFWLCLTRASSGSSSNCKQQHPRHVHPAEGLVQVIDAERAKRTPAPPASTLGSTTP